MARFLSTQHVLMTLALGSGALGLVHFQSCSDVVLVRAPEASLEIVSPDLDLTVTFCPEIEASDAESQKFIFILDMSISNIGDWISEKTPAFSDPLAYFDPSLATDPDGLRYEAIRNFISSCGERVGRAFSVIGFSSSAGSIAFEGGQRKYSCINSSFGDAKMALDQLDSLQEAEKAELPWFLQWKKEEGRYLTDPNFPPIMSGTSYGSALECAQEVLLKDLIQPEEGGVKEGYKVFFISDGTPMDQPGEGCRAEGKSPKDIEDCYLTTSLEGTSFLRQATMAKETDLQVHTIFYGSEDVPDVLRAIAVEGGTSSVVHLGSFQENPDIFCQILGVEKNLELKPDTIAVFNLNAVYRQGFLLADTDGDGIPDIEEIRLGLDPLNPRSSGVSGVLDGICMRVGGIDKCRELREQIDCNPELMNEFKLTDCDMKMLGLKGAETQGWGIDSDGDGVPDIIELIKGTNPALYDVHSNPDGDGMTNLQEIIYGTDPNFYDKDVDTSQLNQFSLSPSVNVIPNCPSGAWDLNVTRMQMAPTVAMPDVGEDFFVANRKGYDQSLFIMYRLTPQNKDISPARYFGRHVLLRKDEDGHLRVDTPSGALQLKPNDFREMGRVYP